MPDTAYIPWNSVQATDRKPVGDLTHVRVVSTGFGSDGKSTSG